MESLLAVLLGSILADGNIGALNGLGVKLGSLPDEVLNEVAVVLGEEQVLGESDDLTGVLDEQLAVGGELGVGLGESIGLQEAV